jgi:Heavy metal binding domain
MLSHRSLLPLSLSFLSACATASGTFLPLGPDHPASALAPAVPITDPSAVLRASGGAAPPPQQAPQPSPSSSVPASAPKGAFVCPMHPEVTDSEAARCPKCGMKLVPRESLEQEAGEHPHAG